MVDRDDEQARLLVNPKKSNGPFRSAVLLAIIAGAVVAAVVGATSVGEPLDKWQRDSSDGMKYATVGLAALIVAGSLVWFIKSLRTTNVSLTLLADLSYRDRLTGLPNRRFLGEPFEEILTRARRSNTRIAVLFMTLDGLASINESYGHEAGDTLVTTIVERLNEELGTEGTLCRYGGAEFIVILHGVTTAASTERFARRMIEATRMPFELGDATLMISSVIGIAITEDRPARPAEILSDAEAAMRQAKRSGSGHYAIFDRSLNELMTPARAERTLREAVDNGEFRLYYQPMVSLWTKRLVGVEAFLRWHAPSRGTVSPDEFLPALEDSGLILPVGAWILNEVCRQSREWTLEYPNHPALNVKVNVSPRQLSQANFVAQLRDAIGHSGIDPGRLFLDIEGSSSTDTNGSSTMLRDLKAVGVNLAMDDFGAGRTSLKDLRRFGLEMLNIDKTFIDGIGRSDEDTKIVEHVIGIAKALGIVTIAEGVETEEQVELLRNMNCDLAQGWYFSHPQPPDVIGQLMASAGNRHEWQPPTAPEAPATETAAPIVRLDRFDHLTTNP